MKNQIVWIMLLAFVLRMLFFRVDETFVSSDEVYLFQNSLKPLSFLLDFSAAHYVAELFRFFNFNWGWVTLSFSTLFVFLLHVLNIPITEQTINLPYVFLGVATVYLVYVLGRELKNEQVGLLAALLFAIQPVHVSTSRSIGLIGVVATFFFLLTFYFFLRYFKRGECRNSAFLSLGFYFAADFQFYGLFPIILAAGIVLTENGSLFKRTISVIRSLFLSKSVLFFFVPTLPVFASAAYLISKNFSHNAYIFHIFSKSDYWGVFLFETVYDVFANYGPALFILFVLGVVYSLFKIFFVEKTDKLNFIVFFWFSINTIPWLFIVNRENTVVFEYVMHLASSMIFLSAFLLDDVFSVVKKKIVRQGILLFIFVPTLILTFFVVYQIDVFRFSQNSEPAQFTHQAVMSPFGVPVNLHFGTIDRNTGIKSAGYWIREHSYKNDVVFSDHESFVGEYYFGRKVVGSLDLFSEGAVISDYKLNRNNSIDYVYLQENHWRKLEETIVRDGFVPIVFVFNKGNLVGTLYSKESQIPVIITTETFDPLFDYKYGNIRSLFVDYP